MLSRFQTLNGNALTGNARKDAGAAGNRFNLLALLPGLFADVSTDRSQGASIGKISEAARTPCLVGGSFPPNGEESKNGKPANHVDLKKHCETLTPFLLWPSRCASPKKNNSDLQRSLGSFPFDFSASEQKKTNRRGRQRFSQTFPQKTQNRL